MAVTFTVNGNYSGSSLPEAFLQACKAGNPSSTAVAIQYSVGNGVNQVNCFDSGWGWVGNFTSPVVTVSGADSAGASASSVQDQDQIVAINTLFPLVLTALALIWAGKRVFELLWSGALNSRPVGGKDE